MSLRILSFALVLLTSGLLVTTPIARALETPMSTTERSVRAVGGVASIAAGGGAAFLGFFAGVGLAFTADTPVAGVLGALLTAVPSLIVWGPMAIGGVTAAGLIGFGGYQIYKAIKGTNTHREVRTTFERELIDPATGVGVRH